MVTFLRILCMFWIQVLHLICVKIFSRCGACLFILLMVSFIRMTFLIIKSLTSVIAFICCAFGFVRISSSKPRSQRPYVCFQKWYSFEVNTYVYLWSMEGSCREQHPESVSRFISKSFGRGCPTAVAPSAGKTGFSHWVGCAPSSKTGWQYLRRAPLCSTDLLVYSFTAWVPVTSELVSKPNNVSPPTLLSSIVLRILGPLPAVWTWESLWRYLHSNSLAFGLG